MLSLSVGIISFAIVLKKIKINKRNRIKENKLIIIIIISCNKRRRMISSGSVTSTNAQLRKIKKPLIERRRRERINECLNQLKALVLEAMNKDESCYSKMEKADILEMTVTHLRSIHQNPISPSQTIVTSTSDAEEEEEKYVLGYNECAKEVGSFLSRAEEVSSGKLGVPLMKHLVTCLKRVQKCSPHPASRRFSSKFSNRSAIVAMPTTMMRTSTAHDVRDTSPLLRSFPKAVALNSEASSVSSLSFQFQGGDVRTSPPSSSSYSNESASALKKKIETYRNVCHRLFTSSTSPAMDISFQHIRQMSKSSSSLSTGSVEIEGTKEAGSFQLGFISSDDSIDGDHADKSIKCELPFKGFPIVLKANQSIWRPW